MKTRFPGRDVGEYDGYEIPPYNPNIPPDERRRQKEEAKKSLDEAIKDALDACKDLPEINS